MQLPAAQMMLTSGHKSEVQMRKHYCWHLDLAWVIRNTNYNILLLAAREVGSHRREPSSASDDADRKVSGRAAPTTPRHSGGGVWKSRQSSGLFEQKSTGRLISLINSD